MHISALEEYGLRCALQLARVFGQGPLSASKISEKEGISVEYVSKIMHLFRKAGVVEAVRGIQGGFVLSKSPSDINLAEIFDSVKTSKKAGTDFCTHYAGNNATCNHFEDCSVRPVWQLISSYFNVVLKDLSLQDLVDTENNARQKIKAVATSKVEFIKGSFAESRPSYV